MAILANKMQQLRHSVRNPMSWYSRVVGFRVTTDGIIGSEFWECTHQVAETVHLLEVQLHLYSNDITVECAGYWLLLTGTTLPSSPAELYQGYDRIIPCDRGDTAHYRWNGIEAKYTWTMNRLYKGSGRRFALWIHNLKAQVWRGQATFKISEG